jgi:hypothetical protein
MGYKKSSLRRVGGFAAKIPQTGFVKKHEANETRVGKVLPQTFPGASGQMDVKKLLHTTASRYGLLPKS